MKEKSSNIPFFSIVIPTKNRPYYLDQAIRSVLLQNFSEYELIISDNFNDENTQEVLSKYKQDSRVKVFRTDREMNMPDHWEFATRKASGKYVLLLADRKLLYQGALKKLHQCIQSYPDIPVFSFHVRSFNDIDHIMGWEAPAIRTRKFRSQDAVNAIISKSYLFGSGNFDYYIPKTLNGIYSNTFATEIRDRFGNYFNTPGITTPDYSSFFINASQCDAFVHFGFPVILTQGEHISNGRIFGSGVIAPYLDTLDKAQIFRKVPMDVPLIFNLLMNDFLVIRKKFGGILKETEPDWLNYFHTLFLDLHLKSKNEKTDKNLLVLYRMKWENALSEMPEDIQHKVLQAVQNPDEQFRLQNKKINGGVFMHFRDFINHRFTKYKTVNTIMKHRFRTGLEAAGFKTE